MKIEAADVAIRGATFESLGDVASKGTGGGLISANTQGPTKFITPGSPTVKIEGKAVHLLGEPMLNNCGPSGSPPNTGSTTPGEDQDDEQTPDPRKVLQDIVCECDRLLDSIQANRTTKANCTKLGEQKHDCCNDGINLHNKDGKSPPLATEQGYRETSGAPDSGASRKWPRGASPEAFFRGIAGRIFPDAAVLDGAGNVDQFAEFKFQCPAGTPTRAGAAPSEGNAVQDWTPARNGKPSQLDRTVALGGKQDPPVTKEPMLITNEDCP